MEAMQTIDMHVHSKHSGRFQLYVLQSLEVDECYTEPRAIYDTCIARGMSMVTITDHDTIAGGLEIAHLGSHVFLSEEVSARFPENGCIVHVLCYGITEAQHGELQRLRRNIYELVAYLRAEDIVHGLAHPLSVVNQRLGHELLQKSLLLFDTLEVVNGQKDPAQERMIRSLVCRVDDRTLARWSERHGIAVQPGRRWTLTAGSDDHSGITMARAHVQFAGAPTFAGLRRALRHDEARAVGLRETSTSYAHTAWAGTMNFFRHSARHRGGGRQTYVQLLDLARGQQLPDRVEELPPVLQRLVPAALEVLAAAPRVPTPRVVAEGGHRPELHDEIYGLAQGALIGAFRACFAQIRGGIERHDPEAIIDEIPTAIRLALLNLPYYFGFRFYHGERRRARTLWEGLAVDATPPRERVAVFCDTLDNVDGVAIGLRRIVAELQAAGREVVLCGADPGPSTAPTERDGVARLPSLGTFPLPGYGEYTLAWPSLLETMRWLDEREIDLVVPTTPGPVGFVAMLAARILGLPVLGQYHTDVAAYARRLFADRSVGNIVEAFTGWFYGTLDGVVAPTHAAARVVEGHGVQADRIEVLGRGVDTTRFDPARRDETLWRRLGLSGENTLLYVGRLSREKNVDRLVQLVRTLAARGRVPVELAIVGDGPHAAALREAAVGLPIAFTGVLAGDALATAFASADLLVFPSTTDTFGNVVLESLASGTPALVTDRGGPAEIVHHRETGLVLPADDVDRWAAAIEGLLVDRTRLARMRDNARAYACTCAFDRVRERQWEIYARRIAAHREAERTALRG